MIRFYNFDFRLGSFQYVALIALCFFIEGCNDSTEGPNNGGTLLNDGQYFLKYDLDGVHFEFFTDETNGAHYEYSTYEDFVAWAPAWKRFYIEPGNYSDYVYVAIALPIDSSEFSLVELNTNYPINGAFGSSFYSPGTVLFTKNLATGSDEELAFADSSYCFNRITSIEYVGNHHYDQIYQLEVCEYEIEGEFKMHLKNDITGELKLLDNGLYRFKVSVVAE